MKIAVVSGKGGAGKTTVAVNLALLLSEMYCEEYSQNRSQNCSKQRASNRLVVLLDCDIEEPNDYLFLPMKEWQKEEILTHYPVIDEAKCIHCKKCGAFCRFNAILNSPKMNIVLKESCHDCGGCAYVCPTQAIHFEKRSIGSISKGRGTFDNRKIELRYGELSVGEFSGVKGIHQLLSPFNKDENEDSPIIVIDGAPGSACNAVASVEAADFVLLVGEPTPFSVSDLSLAVNMVRQLGKPLAIVVNKCNESENILSNYANKEEIPIVGQLPFSYEIASALAKGERLVEHTQFYPYFNTILSNLRELGVAL